MPLVRHVITRSKMVDRRAPTLGERTNIRFGILGAAKVAPIALCSPAADTPGVEVTAIAARDVDRATTFAATHGIPRVLKSYAALVADEEIDAVYNPLPPSGHAPWTIAALEHGKQVLCEKPFACSVEEAEAMVEAGRRANRVLCEGSHWRHRPLADRIRDVLIAGRIGRVTALEAEFSVPLPDRSDIRHQRALGGGALMDFGCYAVQWLRFAAGAEPEVLEAEAIVGETGEDIETNARLRFPGNLPASLRVSMVVGVERVIVLRARGTHGYLEVDNPVVPHEGNRLRITESENDLDEVVTGKRPLDTSWRHSWRRCATARRCRSVETTRSRRCASSTTSIGLPA